MFATKKQGFTMKQHLPYWLIIAIIVTISASSLFAQNSITFTVNNLRAGPATGNYMFHSDDAPRFVQADGDCYTPGLVFPATAWNNYAYIEFTRTADQGAYPYSSTCTAEQLPMIGAGDLPTTKLYLKNFKLKSFRHINTTNQNNDWNNPRGQAGDIRFYADGIGEIFVGATRVLKVKDCRLTVTTPYPNQAQMNAILAPYMANAFDENVGVGDAVQGAGWGTIDTDSSDAAWINAFNQNGTGQVEFTLSSISPVIQTEYGYFTFNINVTPSPFVENRNFRDGLDPLEAAGQVTLAGSAVHIRFDNSAADNGGMTTVFANQRFTDPGGANPGGIQKISPQMYWQIGTTFLTYQADITFDISALTGVTNVDNLRILKRNGPSADWVVQTTEKVDATHLRVNDLTSFSEFAIGSIGADPLPVELSLFTAKAAGTTVQLFWETQTEVSNHGFDIERKDDSDWKKIGFVEGNGNSNSPKQYSYIDMVPMKGSNEYRLKQVDTDGAFEYSGIVKVEFNDIPTEYGLNQNYPNPFNPSTTLSFKLPKSDYVKIRVYDILGNLVAIPAEGTFDAGNHTVTFDATGFAGGVYICRMESGGTSFQRKLSLLK